MYYYYYYYVLLYYHHHHHHYYYYYYYYYDVLCIIIIIIMDYCILSFILILRIVLYHVLLASIANCLANLYYFIRFAKPST